MSLGKQQPGGPRPITEPETGSSSRSVSPAVQRAPYPTATVYAPACEPRGSAIALPIPVRASIQTRVLSLPVATQAPRVSTVTSSGSPPTPQDFATVSRRGSIRLTVPAVGLATHTPVAPAATAAGWGPTGIGALTRVWARSSTTTKICSPHIAVRPLLPRKFVPNFPPALN